MKYDIKEIDCWEAPDCDGAPILTMPNVPLPLFSQCVPADAKFLTPTGWKNISEAEVGDVAMCWANGHLFFDKVEGATKSYQDYAYKIGYEKKRNFDMLYSPQHRLPVETVAYSWGRDGRYKYDTPNKQTKVYTAEEFTPKTSKRFYTSGRGTGMSHTLTNKERVYIAIQADGSLHRTVKTTGLNEYRIKVKKERKAERLREILPTSGLKWTELRKYNDYYEFAIWTPYEAKTFSNVFSYDMGYEKARAFVEELCLWDGHQATHDVFGHQVVTRYYCSTRYDNIEFVQAIAAQSGYTTNTIKRYKGDNPKWHDCWGVWFEDKYYRPCGYMKKEKVEYNDYMYCITVPSSFFLMKWHDKVVITGNCPRTINPAKWELMRKKCYMDADYRCQASGKMLGHGKCQAHELYSVNWASHTSVFKRAVCLDPELHTKFIHSGRALSMFKRHDIYHTQPLMAKAAQRGFSLIYDWNKEHPNEEPLRVSDTFLSWAEHPDLKDVMEKMFELYDVKFYTFDMSCFNKHNWADWKLLYNGRIYPTKFKSQAEWEEEYNPKKGGHPLVGVGELSAFAELDELLKEV